MVVPRRLLRWLPLIILSATTGGLVLAKQPAIAQWVAVAAAGAVGWVLTVPVAPWVRIALLLLAAAVPASFSTGRTEGRRVGFEVGKKVGERDAARRGPVPVIDRGVDAETLLSHSAVVALGPLREGETARFVRVLNRAISPCADRARRGESLASSLTDPKTACAVAVFQLPLVLAALRSLSDDDEVLAALRVERRARPDVTGRPLRGASKPDVVLTVWGDFQCPYCQRAEGLLAQVAAGRPQIGIVWKHLPLSFHPAAEPAARAAEAAGLQGRFWEMAQALVRLGRDLGEGVVPETPEGPVSFETTASGLGLDLVRFRQDFRSQAVIQRIQADQDEGRRLGVNGTPTFYVGDRLFGGRMSLSALDHEAAMALGEAQGRFSWDLEFVPPETAAPKPAPPALAPGP